MDTQILIGMVILLIGILLPDMYSCLVVAPFSVQAKKQATIALSSAEAEYQGAVNACIQAVWLQGILSYFDLGSTLSIVLFCDNKSAIMISTDPVTRQRTKHVEIHMHYIRELVHDKTIILQYCLTDE